MGPPLDTSFASSLPQNQIELAVQLYRSYYKDKGVYEAELFPNIKNILSELAKDYPLYITSTKNTPIAENMIRNFGIDHFFDGIYGSSPQALHKADVIGAQETGIKKLAVTWGFGEEEELMSYQPDWVAHQSTDLLSHLQKKN